MATNDFSKITTMSQLREARKTLSAELDSALSFRNILLPLIRKLRMLISGTPFAKS